jgi:hypothetical protein
MPPDNSSQVRLFGVKVEGTTISSQNVVSAILEIRMIRHACLATRHLHTSKVSCLRILFNSRASLSTRSPTMSIPHSLAGANKMRLSMSIPTVTRSPLAGVAKNDRRERPGIFKRGFHRCPIPACDVQERVRHLDFLERPGRLARHLRHRNALSLMHSPQRAALVASGRPVPHASQSPSKIRASRSLRIAARWYSRFRSGFMLRTFS